ncbi:MAG TPA: TetR/AcrR family transcriptional regulator [Acidimicrobiales bacterium]|jgi:AcrR family transcriptional regulator|nr:TetR/AcrR family transcriptional regulator [Acidimicrobiales bacterium]
MVNQGGVRDHVATAILDAAAAVLAEHGDSASMADVAAAAGVGRATLYRYFPNREQLLHSLGHAALDDAERRLVEADLGSVPVPEALARLTRAVVATGSKFAVLLSEHSYLDKDEVAHRLADPIRSVFQRGWDDGTFRTDLSPATLGDLFGGLLHAAVRMTVDEGLGVERASAIVTSFFFDGARADHRP